MTAPFEVDFSTLPLALRYKLLTALVVPRPIALVTTAGKDGVINAAPFSFFNVFSEDPALVVLGLQSRPDGTPKDTLKHIREAGVFVVNLVDEAMAERMNTCSIDFPSNVSEIGMAGFAILPGVGVPVPRIAEAPVALECRLVEIIQIAGQPNYLVLGEVLRAHVDERIMANGRIDPKLLHAAGRLAGSQYARLGELFNLTRPTYHGLLDDGETPMPPIGSDGRA